MSKKEDKYVLLYSRYYDPNTGRFINADGCVFTQQGIIGFNMYAYCENNPVNHIDPQGDSWIILGLVIVAGTLFLTGCEDKSDTPYSGEANCYAYALSLENDPQTGRPFTDKPQPGSFSGDPLKRKHLMQEKIYVEAAIQSRMEADAEELGLEIERVEDANHMPAEGHWLIALAYT